MADKMLACVKLLQDAMQVANSDVVQLPADSTVFSDQT